MPLLSFSDSKHVPLILNGKKAQTTRTPRKTPIKQGDRLYVYYKSRMKKDCMNCIRQTCRFEDIKCRKGTQPGLIAQWCGSHTNFFGTAETIKVEYFDPLLLSSAALEEWAKADGFLSFEEADSWFSRVHGKDWIYKSWDIIYFKGDWVNAAPTKNEDPTTLKELVTQLAKTHYWVKKNDASTLAVVTGHGSTVRSDGIKSVIVNYRMIINLDTVAEEESEESCTIFDFFKNFTPVKEKKR